MSSASLVAVAAPSVPQVKTAKSVLVTICALSTVSALVWEQSTLMAHVVNVEPGTTTTSLKALVLSAVGAVPIVITGTLVTRAGMAS